MTLLTGKEQKIDLPPMIDEFAYIKEQKKAGKLDDAK